MGHRSARTIHTTMIFHTSPQYKCEKRNHTWGWPIPFPPPTLFEASHGFFFLTLSTNSFQVSSDTCCRHLRPFPPGLKDKKQGFFKKHFPRKFLWLPPRFSRLSGAPGSSSCYTWKQSNFPEWNCTSWNIREKWRNARNQHAPKYEPLPKGWVL